MGKTWKKKTSSKKREEHRRTIWMSIGSDSTQYVAPSPRCDPSMSQPRWVCTPKCQIENHHDMELTDSADSGDGYRCCARNSHRQIDSHSLWFATIFQFSDEIASNRPYLNVSQCISEIGLTTCPKMERVVLHWCVLIFSLFFLYFLQLMS